jgi:cell pole-organizing protein PopZ
VFAKLAPNTTLPGMFISGNTVEAMVGELIKPMLKEWLDANLPRIVEEKVEAEVARIARRSF